MSVPWVDPDVDLHAPGQHREWSRHRFVLPAIALGGMLGASARYAAARVWPTPEAGVPWTTLGVNAVGCLLIGVLMVFVVEVGGAHPLLRPFAGVGVLGGFTTFSTYTVDTVSLLDAGRPAVALGYWAGTVLVALVAVLVGVVAARAGVLSATRLRRRRRAHRTTRGEQQP
ncbi:MAG: fluoride efflux transporter CrcB [Nocardioides sp.]|nr:fluoride efflux transporter CrcB [Nocardioides sp.]